MNKREYLIEEEGSLKKYRTEIPNTLIKGEFSKKLSVHDKFLYIYLKSVTGENGMSWQSTRTLSKNTGISTGQISKSKKNLANNGLINLKKGDKKKGKSDTITINDIWVENMVEFRQNYPRSLDEHPCSPHQQTRSSHESSPSPNEHPCSSDEPKNNPLEEEPYKEKPKKNTTTKQKEITSEMEKVIEAWDDTFEVVVDKSDDKLINAISTATQDFEISDLLQAIEYRSQAKFYKEDYPHLRDAPKYFFCYPKTIKNDMIRRPFKLITYDKKCQLEQDGTSKKFEKCTTEKDNLGRPKWRMYE